MYPIPRNATRIEYLESNGSQWIDTGINGQSGLVINAKFWMQRDSIQGATSFFGCYVESGTTNRFYVGAGNRTAAGPIVQFGYNNKQLLGANEDNDFIIALNDNEALINGEEYSATASTFDNGLHMHVFGSNRSNTHIVGTNRTMRMKSFSVSKNGVMLCDYVPVRVGNVGCVFDRVTGQFIYGSGTGDFVYGPDDVSKFAHAVKHISKDDSKPYDAEAEYIESTGTQYIDTGIEPTTDMVTKAEFTILETNGSYGVVCSYPYNDGNDYRIFENRSDSWKKIFHDRHGGRIYTNMYDSHHYVLEAGNLYMKDLTTGETMVSGSAASGSWGSSYTTRIFFNAASEKARVYWCQFYKNGQLVGDFIPVRVGNEYCLYDKANPTGGDNGDGLYHNKGTGAFLGKDKGKVMASRVKGKENELPYDAEVEYVESDGTQYVDTGVNADSSLGFKIKCTIGAEWGHFIGAMRDSTYLMSFRQGGHAKVQRGSLSSVSGPSSNATTPNVYFVDTITNSCGVDSVSTTRNTGAFDIEANFYLFAGNRVLSSQTNIVKVSSRLWYAQLWVSGNLVRDFQPVRVGQVGYLYDKVSGELFGSATVTPLIAGPDRRKIKPVRKHYDLATYYTIDECNGNTPTMVNANFPSDKYDALDYTPTWAHHRFIGWYSAFSPPGCTRLDYVEATGSQYINLPSLSQSDCDYIEIVLSVPSLGYRNFLLGGASSSAGYFEIDANNKAKVEKAGTTTIVADRIYVITFRKDTLKLYLDGVEEADLTYNTTTNFFNSTTNPLRIFGMTGWNTYGKAKLYGFRAYNAGVLLSNLIPAKNANFVAGVYDTVSGAFYPSSSSTALVSGNDNAGIEISPSDAIVYGIHDVYARWQLPTTVTFDATTGGGQMPGGWTAPDYYEGQPFGTLPTPTHSTLNFSGWYDGSGNKVTESTIVTANNKALTAQYSAQSYTVDISNGDWELEDPNTNPDTSAYDGVYRNLRYWNSPPGAYVDKLYIDVIGYTSFTVYIRSYAEVNYSYTVAVKADYDPTSFTDAINNKQGATTANNNSTGISAYTAVTYTLDGGSHRICIAYGHKDSIKQNDDRGYLLIPKQQ